jgi:hypothetical protein
MPTQPPIQWVTEGLASGVKRAEREVDSSRPSTAEVKNGCSYTSISLHVFMTWCLIKHRDKFAIKIVHFALSNSLSSPSHQVLIHVLTVDITTPTVASGCSLCNLQAAFNNHKTSRDPDQHCYATDGRLTPQEFIEILVLTGTFQKRHNCRINYVSLIHGFNVEKAVLNTGRLIIGMVLPFSSELFVFPSAI